MADESNHEAVAAAMRQINEAWLGGQVQNLVPLVHPDMTMVFPGFAGRIQGREAFLAGFSDFCQNATVREFRDFDHLVDVVGDSAVVTFRYEMVYQRLGKESRSTGRDLWVFQKQGTTWIAVWRTMLELEENPV